MVIDKSINKVCMNLSKTNITLAIQYVILIILAISMLLPMLVMVSTSLKNEKEALKTELDLVPKEPTINNYAKVWKQVKMGRAFINSLIVSFAITFGQLLTCSMAAYAFARLNFPGRDKIFFAYIATMMIPAAVIMIPVFILTNEIPNFLNRLLSPENKIFSASLYYKGEIFLGRLTGINSYFALITQSLFSAWGTFMLRQFFMSIPKELEDAARIDGCGLLKIYWNVILPLSKPAMATLGIFVFMGSWKNFMWPLIVSTRQEMMTLPVVLQLLQGEITTDWEVLMAGMVIALIPTLIIFMFGQRYFIKGIQMGALKG